MKFLISTVMIALLSLLLQLFLPWWSIVIAAALGGTVFSLGSLKSFFCGFLGTAIVWWMYAWIIDLKNQSILSAKIAELFNMGTSAMLILFCGMLAGIVGGLAALSGSEAKKIL